jgi:hypothetical protein
MIVDKKQTSRVLTFESWVTEAPWFKYATSHPDKVAHLLSDRSPCQDPFFDLFSPSRNERLPMITGLCRCIKNFKEGDRYIYVTKLSQPAMRSRDLDPSSGPRYFGVASMIVAQVYPSHDRASLEFHPRRYVIAPVQTPYPPGLAHNPQPVAAVSSESCIVHAQVSSSKSSSPRQVALTPDQATPGDYRSEYEAYHERQTTKHLRAARCSIESVEGREALAVNLDTAPVLSSADWEGHQQNVMGIRITEETARALVRRIADAG